MTLIRPRLTDYYNIPLLQSEVDFAIPFIDEDIPLYVDPFLLWKSPSQQDNSLHQLLLNSFNGIGNLFIQGKEDVAINNLIHLSECNEVGLGTSKSRMGKLIGNNTAKEILNLFKLIPQINRQGFEHFEQIQLLIDNISKDRISDITCSLIKSFLIDYTIDQCRQYGIPIENVDIFRYDYKRQTIISEKPQLPINPDSRQPIILVPKRWLRYSPWVNYEDYFESYYIKDIEKEYDGVKNRIKVLTYNRENYDAIQKYTALKERAGQQCQNDPLFKQIPILSAKRKINDIIKLPTGKTDNADKKYEALIAQTLASLLYPHLDFAQEQSRIDSGTQIRDLIFYNNRSIDFLETIYDNFESKQIVVELKNVQSIEREHINQLNRYLSEQFGKFGIIFTRNKPSKAMYKNTIDLWSGQRRCILILDDDDLKMMNQVYESKQRHPLEVIKKKFIEFTRNCPN